MNKIILVITFSLVFAITSVLITSGLVLNDYVEYTVTTDVGDIEFDRWSYGWPVPNRLVWYSSTIWLDSERLLFPGTVVNWIFYLLIGLVASILFLVAQEYLSKLESKST